jgi:hypothetical protein
MAAGLLGAMLFTGAAPALASAACPQGATSYPFAAEGDHASYTLVTGGVFAEGAPGWVLSNAEVVREGQQEGGIVYALSLKPRGVAVSPAFCVSSEFPTFRFRYRQKRGGGKLYVHVQWTDGSGSHDVPAAELEGNRRWASSPVLQLASLLPLEGPASTLTTVRLVFGTSHPGLEWAIADVYIDPYRR